MAMQFLFVDFSVFFFVFFSVVFFVFLSCFVFILIIFGLFKSVLSCFGSGFGIRFLGEEKKATSKNNKVEVCTVLLS